ncbi:hypothetical protein C8Q77DRAFT_1279367 [Trametes polyzona]|nr:hypothetical protein C8Q77DRAFT_1279367 [Trametes polyzona]
MACVYNVPMALDATYSRTDGLDPHFAMVRNQKHVAKVKGCTVGPMPPAQFLDTFLPIHTRRNTTGMLSPRDAFQAVPRSAENPEEIYKPLCAALNKKRKGKTRCPGFTFVNTIARSIRPVRLGYTKPHISCFTTQNALEVHRADKASRVELGYAELFINIRTDASMDFFVDPPAGLDKQALKAHNFARIPESHELAKYDQIQRAFGLHVGFATELFARQYRLCLFTISLCGPMARLFRWDRAGCVVTEAFDIHETPETLLDFLWRFSQVSFLERGHDSRVTIASPAQEALFRDVVRFHVRAQLELEGEDLEKAVRAHYSPGRVALVEVHMSAPDGQLGVRRLIVSRPVVSPLRLEGRGTRGFWAVCTESKSIGFLKDTWCSDPRGVREGEILHDLNKVGVSNIPTLYAHGDVPDDYLRSRTTYLRFQTTHTARFAKAAWACRINGQEVHVNTRRHYRLFTDTIGYGLHTVRSTHELLHAAHDVLQAMRSALANASRLHRDISFGNVVLVKTPQSDVRRGCLIDWEISDRVDETKQSLETGRAGTWDFMSIRMLEENPGKHTIADDMESLFYVVLYTGLMYLSHNLKIESLTNFVSGFFRSVVVPGVGGSGKFVNSLERWYTRFVHFRSAAFQEWLNTVMNYHSPMGEDKEKYKDMWDPARLDAFWSEFLATRELDKDDRMVHTLSMFARGRVQKRSGHEAASALSSPPKRARRARSAVESLRRSERIHNRRMQRRHGSSTGSYLARP